MSRRSRRRRTESYRSEAPRSFDREFVRAGESFSYDSSEAAPPFASIRRSADDLLEPLTSEPSRRAVEFSSWVDYPPLDRTTIAQEPRRPPPPLRDLPGTGLRRSCALISNPRVSVCVLPGRNAGK